VAISGSGPYLTGQMQEVDDALHRLSNTLGAEILDSLRLQQGDCMNE